MSTDPRPYVWRDAELVVDGRALSPMRYTDGPPSLRALPPVHVVARQHVDVVRPPDVIDGVSLPMRGSAAVLLTRQDNPAENGPWVYECGFPMRRALWLDVGADAEGAMMFVLSGDMNSGSTYVQTRAAIVGRDPMEFQRYERPAVDFERSPARGDLSVAQALAREPASVLVRETTFVLPREAQVEYVALQLDGMRARSPVSDSPAFRRLLRAQTARVGRIAWAYRTVRNIDAARVHAAAERAAIVRWLDATRDLAIPFGVVGGVCAGRPRPRNPRLRTDAQHPSLGRGVVRALACEALTGRRCRARSRAPWPLATCANVNKTALPVNDNASDVNNSPSLVNNP